MPTLRVTVHVEVDGTPLVGSPFVRRLTVDELVGLDAVEKDGDNGATAFSVLGPAQELDVVQALLLHADKPVTVRLDNQSTKGVRLAAGGLLLVVGATIDAGASVNVLLNNPATAGDPALLGGVVAGT